MAILSSTATRCRLRFRSLFFLVLLLLFLFLFLLQFYSVQHYIPQQWTIPNGFSSYLTGVGSSFGAGFSTSDASSLSIGLGDRALQPPYYHIPTPATSSNPPNYPSPFPPTPPQHTLQYHLLPPYQAPTLYYTDANPIYPPQASFITLNTSSANTNTNAPAPSSSHFLSHYPTLNLLGLIPEFQFLHPIHPKAHGALFLSIYESRYDFSNGQFHLLAFLHCNPNTPKSNKGSTAAPGTAAEDQSKGKIHWKNGCRLKASTGEQYPLQPQLEMESMYTFKFPSKSSMDFKNRG